MSPVTPSRARIGLILYPGPDHPESLANVLRGRGHHAERYEYLDDPVRQDLENADLQVQVIESIERGEWNAVLAQTPCSSFSVAQEPAIRTLGEPGGTAEAMPHWERYLARGNAHAQFTAAVCTAAAKAGTNRAIFRFLSDRIFNYQTKRRGAALSA